MRLSASKFPTRRVIVSVITAVLFVCLAGIAGAEPSPTAGLPSGWVLQQTEPEGVMSISFANPNDGWALLGDGQLVQTTDGGHSWSNVTATGWDPSLLRAISFATSQIGWAVGNYESVYNTVDGGKSWSTVQQSSDSSYTLYDVKAVDDAHVWAVGGTNSSNYLVKAFVLATADGSTWTTQTLNFTPQDKSLLTALHMVDAHHGAAVGNDGEGYPLEVNLESDGSWSAGSVTGGNPQAPFTSVWFTDAQHGWATRPPYDDEATATVYSSTDYGVTWSPISVSGTPTEYQYPDAIMFLDSLHGFLGASSDQSHGGVFLKTTDGGMTWTAYDPEPSDANGGSGISVFASTDALHAWAGGGWSMSAGDPGGIWGFVPATTPVKQYIGAPIISPQFRRTPFTVEDHDWLKAAGSISPRHKPRSYSIVVSCEKRVGKKWVVKKIFRANLSKSGWTYAAKVRFPSRGSWRIRAMHSSSVKSGYTYYTVIADGWDIP